MSAASSDAPQLLDVLRTLPLEQRDALLTSLGCPRGLVEPTVGRLRLVCREARGLVDVCVRELSVNIMPPLDARGALQQTRTALHRVFEALPSRWPRCTKLGVKLDYLCGPFAEAAVLWLAEVLAAARASAQQLRELKLEVFLSEAQLTEEQHEILYCRLAEAAVLACPQLQKLVVRGDTQGTSKEALEALSRLPHLEDLTLPWGVELQHIGHLCHLKRLVLDSSNADWAAVEFELQRLAAGLPHLVHLQQLHITTRHRSILQVLEDLAGSFPPSLQSLKLSSGCTPYSACMTLSSGRLRSVQLRRPSVHCIAALRNTLSSHPELLQPGAGACSIRAEDGVRIGWECGSRAPLRGGRAAAVARLLQQGGSVEVGRITADHRTPAASVLQALELGSSTEELDLWLSGSACIKVRIRRSTAAATPDETASGACGCGSAPASGAAAAAPDVGVPHLRDVLLAWLSPSGDWQSALSAHPHGASRWAVTGARMRRARLRTTHLLLVSGGVPLLAASPGALEAWLLEHVGRQCGGAVGHTAPSSSTASGTEASAGPSAAPAAAASSSSSSSSSVRYVSRPSCCAVALGAPSRPAAAAVLRSAPARMAGQTLWVVPLKDLQGLARAAQGVLQAHLDAPLPPGASASSAPHLLRVRLRGAVSLWEELRGLVTLKGSIRL